MAYSALLRHLRCRTLGDKRIIHTDSNLCDSAYPVIQDPEVNLPETQIANTQHVIQLKVHNNAHLKYCIFLSISDLHFITLLESGGDTGI